MDEAKKDGEMHEVAMTMTVRLSADELAVLEELGELAGSQVRALREIVPHLLKRALRGEVNLGVDLEQTVCELERAEIVRRMAGLATGQFGAVSVRQI